MYCKQLVFIVCMILLSLVAVNARYNDVVISNRKLFHSGQEFYVKGIAYSPTPLGYNSMNLDGTGGTGLCSPRLTFDNKMKSACHERDYVDGIINPATGKAWFIDMWRRDFAILKELGVNTVRPFFASPVTQKFLRDNPTIYPTANPNQGSILRTFLDVCQEFGLKAIIPVTPDMTMLMNTPDDVLDKMVKAIIEEIGDHDALLMYAIGNEMPVHVITSLRDIVNRQMDRVKAYSQQIWGRSALVSHANVDSPVWYEFLMRELHHDVYFSNVYRDDVYSMFEGEQGYKGMDELTRVYNKAVLITEIGRHQMGYVENENVPYWFNRLWKSIIDTKNRGNIGAVFFEYSNEQWKDILQQTMGLVNPVVGYDSTGQSSTTLNAFVLDQMQRIPIIFDAVKQGREPFAAYHFNTNVWAIRGETPATLGTNPNPPPPPPPPPTPSPVPPPPPTPSPNPPPPTPPPPPPTDPRCGAGLSYCNDVVIGSVCFSTTQYVCAKNKRLCPLNNDVCGTACFETRLYQCCEATGQIYQKSQTLPSNCGTTNPPPPPPPTTSPNPPPQPPPPVPQPPPSAACGGQAACGNQCYDPNVFQCNTDAQGVSRLCPKGFNSCGIACYNPSQYKCCGTTLKQPFEAC